MSRAADLALALAGAGALGFLLVKAYRTHVVKPAAPASRPANTGVLGSTVAANPTAPKTTGDLARYDHIAANLQTAADAVVTTGDFARLDRAYYGG